jgi:hypothetical protein
MDNSASPAPSQTQGQNQTQEQNVTITVESSDDPVLEHRIFATGHSAGRQLGYLSAVVGILVDAYESDPKAAARPGARDAIADFRRAQADIDRIKRLREPERIVEELRTASPERARHLRDELRAWLAQFDAPAKPAE